MSYIFIAIFVNITDCNIIFVYTSEIVFTFKIL